MQTDGDGMITVAAKELPDGAAEHRHIVVRDHDAEPAVARVLEVQSGRAVIRVLPGSVEDNADILERDTPTQTG